MASLNGGGGTPPLASRFSVRLVLLALTAAFVAFGCGSETDSGSSGDTAPADAPEAEPQPGGSLVVAVPLSEPDALLHLTLEPLTAFADDGTVVPYLAESVEANETFDRWTITLRSGISFHDGEPLDAEAVKANLDTYSTSPVYRTDPFAPITATSVVDDLTVEVELARPWASFPAHLTAEQSKGTGLIASPSTIEAMGALFLADPTGADVAGTGPFVHEASESTPEQQVFVRNPDYWQEGLPYLDQVEVRVVPENASRLSDLDAGDVDVVVTGQPPGDRDDQRILTQSGDPEVLAVALNTTRPPFDDPGVREAVAAATDVEALAAEAGVDPSMLTTGPFGPDSTWSDPETTPATPDPDRARALIAAYEQENGPITIEFGAQDVDADSLEIQRLLAEQWGEVGIEVELDVIDPFARTVTLLIDGDFDAVLEPLFGLPDPDMYYFWWHSSALKGDDKGIGYNYVGIDDSELDTALDEARATSDDNARRAAFSVVQERLDEVGPYVWLWAVRTSAVANPRVHGLDAAPLPDGGTRWPILGRGFNLEGVWLDQ